MPIERPKLRYSLDEILGVREPSPKEVEIPRTVGLPSDPNFTEPMAEFSLGLQNSKETVLSNMIAEKTQGASFGLSEFLDCINTQQSRLFDFLYRIIERLLGLEIPADKAVSKLKNPTKSGLSNLL